MKKSHLFLTLLCLVSLIPLGAWVTPAVADPEVLFIGGPSCAAPPGCPLFMGHVNPISPTSLTITENGAGLPALINPVLLILGLPNVNSSAGFSPPAITLSMGTGAKNGGQVFPTTTTKWDANGFAGSFTAAFAGTPPGVYNFIGLNDPDGGSENFVNWSAADFAVNQIVATGFGIFVYELINTGLMGGSSVTVTFADDLPRGTFAVAYGCSSLDPPGPTGPNPDGRCPGANTFSTPFTQSGLVVPEPASLLLFGSGLVGLGAAARKRFFSRLHK